MLCLVTSDFTVAERLSDFARRLLNEPSLKESLDVPVLVWEAPPASASAPASKEPPTTQQIAAMRHSMGATQQLPIVTVPGVRRERLPGSPEPLVLPLVKGDSPTNAFVMGVTVGRTENNDLVLNDPSVSRFHAYFLRDRRTNAWRLVDAESMNGTWVGALKLQPNVPVDLYDQARLRFGDVEMLFVMPASLFDELARRTGAPGAGESQG